MILHIKTILSWGGGGGAMLYRKLIRIPGIKFLRLSLIGVTDNDGFATSPNTISARRELA